MTILCTYCTDKKDHSEGEMPAIRRYRSPRISSVYSAALSLGLGFAIVSGEYGILDPCDPIPDYVHLLLPEEVPEHSGLVAGQLAVLGADELVFFTKRETADPNVKPYCESISKACKKARVELKFVYLS